MSKVVIQIEDLWKEYRLGVIGHGTLTRDLQSWWAKVRGKEDPNSKIAPMLAGQEKQIEGDRFWALRGINLEVKEGEILGIIGKNGAGKSTLLKLLSRVTAPTKGQIKIKGRIASLLEVGTGFHPELTGRENIFMNGAILGMSKQEIKSKLDEIINFSGVEKFIDTPVKRYSSGMYVRLAFAVAAHLEPEILVVDEVLAVGDAEFQKKCLGKMGEVSRAGRTVLFVSHNLAAVRSLCEKSVLLENGQLIFSSTVSDIIERYLSSSFVDQNSASIYWKNSEEAPGGDKVVLSAIEMRDERGVPASSYCQTQQISVYIAYQVLKELDAIKISVQISNLDRTVIVTSFNLDNENNIARSNPGKYSVTCIVPAMLLNEGNYILSIHFGIPNYEVLIPRRDCLQFKILQTSTYNSSFRVKKREGLISPMSLKWSDVKRVKSVNA